MSATIANRAEVPKMDNCLLVVHELGPFNLPAVAESAGIKAPFSFYGLTDLIDEPNPLHDPATLNSVTWNANYVIVQDTLVRSNLVAKIADLALFYHGPGVSFGTFDEENNVTYMPYTHFLEMAGLTILTSERGARR